MGEPVKPIHTRVYEFALWPFDSISELADYSGWATDLVRQAAQVEPSTTLSFNIPGPRGTEPPIRLDELRERLDEFPLDKVFEASLAQILQQARGSELVSPSKVNIRVSSLVLL